MNEENISTKILEIMNGVVNITFIYNSEREIRYNAPHNGRVYLKYRIGRFTYLELEATGTLESYHITHIKFRKWFKVMFIPIKWVNTLEINRKLNAQLRDYRLQQSDQERKAKQEHDSKLKNTIRKSLGLPF